MGDATLLENKFLPVLEVNAAFGDLALEHPISIYPSRPENSQLEGHDLAGSLIALEVLPAPLTSSIWVEQVAWTQGTQLARVWCEYNDASDWQALVAVELARSLERDAGLLAYLAYVDDAAVGMMIASSDGICGLWAGADDVARALFARGAHDLERLAVTVASERRSAFLEASESARFDIFIAGNWDRQ